MWVENIVECRKSYKGKTGLSQQFMFILYQLQNYNLIIIIITIIIIYYYYYCACSVRVVARVYYFHSRFLVFTNV